MITRPTVPDWLRLCLSQAIVGEIYPAIRVICVRYKERRITIRAYFDREPTDYDHDAIDVICLNMEEHCADNFDYIDVECMYSITPIGFLEILDGVIYARREYDD